MALKGKTRKRSRSGKARGGAPARTHVPSRSKRPRVGILVAVVAVVALLTGGIVGWAIGRTSDPQELRGSGRSQMESYQGRVDRTMESILQPLGQEGNVLAFAQLLTDADAFAKGELPAKMFKDTARNASAAAQEAVTALESIPLSEMIAELPDQLGTQVGFATLQLENSMGLYGQAAELYLLAAESDPAASKGIADRAALLRQTGDSTFKDAITEYNAALRAAGLTPRYGGEAATTTGGAGS